MATSLDYVRAEVSLIRLVDGEIPPYPVFFFQDSVLNQTLLDNIVSRRAPELMTHYFSMKGRTEERLDATLAFLADAARAYASDIFGGDFSIFEAIQAERREHARQHPPKVTVWGPVIGSAVQLEQVAEIARQSTPDVDVEVRLYTPPGKSKRGKAADTQGRAAGSDERPPFGFHSSKPK